MDKAIYFLTTTLIIIALWSIGCFMFADEFETVKSNQAEIIRLLQPDIAIDTAKCVETGLPGKYKVIKPKVKK